jgi:hypothetical protein
VPYIDGKRVSNEEWTAKYGSIQSLHTGPNGDNPAGAPVIDPELGTVKVQKKQRSKRSSKAVKAAVADALGVATTSDKLDELDVSSIDAEAAE